MTGRILYLDGIRGLAALSVAIMHFPIDNYISNSSFFSNSFLFVDLFFVLSGFILTILYSGFFSPIVFLKLRFARIAPVYYLTLFFGIVLEFLKLLFPDLSTTQSFSGSNDFYSLLREVLLIQSLPIFSNTSFDPPNWSISSEAFAYLVMSLFLLISPARRLVFWTVMFISMLFISMSISQLNNAHELAIYRCFFGFSAGVLVAHFINKWESLSFGSYSNLATLVIIILTIAYIWIGGLPAFPPALFFSIILLALHCSKGELREYVFSNKTVVFLGDISLSLYLVHYFIAMRFEEIDVFFTKGEAQVELLFLSYLLVVIFMSFVMFRYYEVPLRKLLRPKIK